jgi:hypothetical protein
MSNSGSSALEPILRIDDLRLTKREQELANLRFRELENRYRIYEHVYDSPELLLEKHMIESIDRIGKYRKLCDLQNVADGDFEDEDEKAKRLEKIKRLEKCVGHEDFRVSSEQEFILSLATRLSKADAIPFPSLLPKPSKEVWKSPDKGSELLWRATGVIDAWLGNVISRDELKSPVCCQFDRNCCFGSCDVQNRKLLDLKVTKFQGNVDRVIPCMTSAWETRYFDGEEEDILFTVKQNQSYVSGQFHCFD